MFRMAGLCWRPPFLRRYTPVSDPVLLDSLLHFYHVFRRQRNPSQGRIVLQASSSDGGRCEQEATKPAMAEHLSLNTKHLKRKFEQKFGATIACAGRHML